MLGPEDFQQLPVGDFRAVKGDQYRFGVVADGTVGGRFGGAPRIAGDRCDYSFDAPEPGVDAPESAEPEDGHLQVLGFGDGAFRLGEHILELDRSGGD